LGGDTPGLGDRRGDRRAGARRGGHQSTRRGVAPLGADGRGGAPPTQERGQAARAPDRAWTPREGGLTVGVAPLSQVHPGRHRSQLSVGPRAPRRRGAGPAIGRVRRGAAPGGATTMQLPRASLPRAPTMGPEDAAPQSPPWTGTAPIGRRSPPRRPNTPSPRRRRLLRPHAGPPLHPIAAKARQTEETAEAGYTETPVSI